MAYLAINLNITAHFNYNLLANTQPEASASLIDTFVLLQALKV